MITAELVWDGGYWRTYANRITITCDQCKATTKATGTDHNGPALEDIYAPDGWRLAQGDKSEDVCKACFEADSVFVAEEEKWLEQVKNEEWQMEQDYQHQMGVAG